MEFSTCFFEQLIFTSGLPPFCIVALILEYPLAELRLRYIHLPSASFGVVMVVLHSGEAPIEPISFKKATSCIDLSARSSGSNAKIFWSADLNRDI